LLQACFPNFLILISKWDYSLLQQYECDNIANSNIMNMILLVVAMTVGTVLSYLDVCGKQLSTQKHVNQRLISDLEDKCRQAQTG
jgi:hypothetical protein